MRKFLILGIMAIMTVTLYGCTEEIPKEDDDEVINEEPIFIDSGLNYAETLINIQNPERGFYYSLEASLSASTTSPLWSEESILNHMKQFSFFHLRIGLEEFSTNAGGKDGTISKAALDSLKNSLEVFRNVNASVVVRFSYNRKGLRDSNGYINAEPAMNLIEIHVNQLGTILLDYYDVIASVETGMFGPWGEQHSTTMGDSSITNSLNYFRLIESWLKVLPSGCNISVRRPLYYMYWANVKYGFKLNSENIGDFNFIDYPQYPDLKRLGVYNDGYLGSETDLGTYANRASEVKWLSNQTQYILFGGEVVADNQTGSIGNYNTISYLEEEAYLTHTSYLNYFWNYNKVISKWEVNEYNGTNELYKTKTNEYTYVANHLGYRFVLKESTLANDYQKSGKLYLKGKIENVGFASIVNEKDVEIVIQSGTEIYYITVPFDVRDMLSKSTTAYDFTILLPENLSVGEYSVYFKISDTHELKSSAFRTIQFANDESYWNSTIGANLLGKFTIN